MTAAEVPRGAALPRITQPRSAPVVGTDAHLAALRDEHLHPDSIRARLARLHAGLFTPEFAGDGERVLASHAGSVGRGPTPASVLVPLVHRQDGLHLLLTQRTAHLHDHAGQVSFPGGRADPGDVDAVATALREAEEEVGLPPHCVEVLGCLPVYTTVTSYVVTPVVALVEPPQALQLDAFEVAEAFEVPLSFLMNPANHQRHEVDFGGLRRHFLSMPWQPPGREDAYFIWGATAAMIRNLYRVLA